MSDDNSDSIVVAKKITKKFIPWDDDLALEVLFNAFQKKPHAAQKKPQRIK
jgi:phosphorylcholine metabolism protein LicD